MSKSVRKIIGVVAAIAVPFAAPAIASTIGLSGALGGMLGSATLGSTFGGALTGAVLGGAASKLQGGKFGSGALMGGIGGGIGGYMTAPTGAPTSNLAAGSIQATPGSGVLAATPGAAPPSIADMAAGLKLPAGGGVLAAPTTATATPGFLANLPAATGMASAVTPSAANAPGLLANIGAATAQNFRTMTGVGAAPGTAAPGTAAAGKAAYGPALVQGATTLAAGALSGPSAAERRMMEQQTESLRAATAANEAAYRERLNEARKLIGESAYFDPEYAGLQSARRAQIAGSRAKREGLRGMTGGERQAEARRYDLDTARTTGTAYDVGYGTGVGNRLATRQAGLAMFPGAYPDSVSSYSSLMSAYGNAEDRAAGQAQNIGKFAGDLYGAYTSQKKG